jgi:hypothetical protein
LKLLRGYLLFIRTFAHFKKGLIFFIYIKLWSAPLHGLAQLLPHSLYVPREVATLGKKLEAVAQEAGNNVQVGVEDHLAGGVEIVHAQVNAPGEEILAQGLSHSPGDLTHLQPQLIRKVQKGFVVLFRNHQSVAIMYRGDVQEGQDPGGLYYLDDRGLAGGDTAKNTIRHDF